MTNRSEKMKTIRTSFGLVIYNSQLVQQQLLLMIVAADLNNKHAMPHQELKNLFGNCFNHTIERIKRDLRDYYRLTSDEIEMINQFLRLRNVFSFKYFGKRTAELYSDEGQSKMIKELEAASYHINRTLHMLRISYQTYLKKHKLFKEHILIKVKKLFSPY